MLRNEIHRQWTNQFNLIGYFDIVKRDRLNNAMAIPIVEPFNHLIWFHCHVIIVYQWNILDHDLDKESTPKNEGSYVYRVTRSEIIETLFNGEVIDKKVLPVNALKYFAGLNFSFHSCDFVSEEDQILEKISCKVICSDIRRIRLSCGYQLFVKVFLKLFCKN